MKDKIHKVTEPMKNELVLLKEVNKKLQDELTVMKSKQKEEQERNDKITEVLLKEHQITMARSDKDNRAKQLILVGVPENQISIGRVDYKRKRRIQKDYTQLKSD